ncbi:MAG TPA: FliM/FliN family flagellar motor switch protein, partial [Solirubrobacteraceae bacterium]|nr:FliM/FliN family flagellar motor switch protein [Solirubrobacteraceae bacterium]
MSEDAPHHQLEETPPGDARDPARSEVGFDAADVPSADAVSEAGQDPADAPPVDGVSEAGNDPAGDPQVEEASHDAAAAPPAQVMGEAGQDATDVPSADVAGEVGDVGMGVGAVGGHAIRTVDFSQPTKFTAELRRRIVRALGSFCEAFALRLSTELRAPVELGVADSRQLTWAAAKAPLPANTIAVALGVQPINAQMLLCIEPPLVLQALECLLGGHPAQAASERRFSEVDWALTRRLLQSMIAQLGPAWRDLGGLELSLGEVDLEGDGGVLVPIGEPTFAITLESRIDDLPSGMSLLIPWSAIGPIAEEILGSGPRLQDTDSREAHAMRRGLAGAHVCLRAEVGAREMPVERMLALTPGTLLGLHDRATEGVVLFAEGVPIGRGQPGLRGAQRAVKLTEAVARAGERAGGLPTNPMQALFAQSAPGAPHPDPGGIGQPTPEQAEPTRESLARMMDVQVRVWAELGRTTLPLGQALELPPGTVVELDQGAESPIELFVNGTRFAHGTLLDADGE